MDRSYKALSLPRLVALSGVKNCRDLGGYPTADGFLVRPRRIFRAGEYGLAPFSPGAHLGAATARSRVVAVAISRPARPVDRMSEMTDDDLATLRQLNVHTVLDLRSEPEVATRGIGLLEYGWDCGKCGTNKVVRAGTC